MKSIWYENVFPVFLLCVVPVDARTIQPRKRGKRPLASTIATETPPLTRASATESPGPAVPPFLHLLGGEGGKSNGSILRSVWNFGTKSWKFAVGKMTPKTNGRRSPNGADDNVDMLAEYGDYAPESFSTIPRLPQQYSPLKMYISCMSIVTLWIMTGTLFYSHVNKWPLPQSFFYAVDAGMSIGFCTDVREIKLVSKAFTVVFIVLGASVVGGALWLFIQDIVEGVVDRERKNNSSILTKEYELMLEKEIFEKFDADQNGSLSKDEFATLLRAIASTDKLSESDIDVLWTKFDSIKDGKIIFEEFAGTSRCIKELIGALHDGSGNVDGQSIATKFKESTFSLRNLVFSRLTLMWNSENRIYGVFFAWVSLGVTWGIIYQNWDPITSTHFAISALATGGLTGPEVNSEGILPTWPSLFCGTYCLLGIPLMAITFGHFAQRLVSDHVAALEEWMLTRPMTATDYKIAKQYLFREMAKSPSKSIRKGWRQQQQQQQQSPLSPSPSWRGLRLSDFVVLQLLRQGKISIRTLDILKREFEMLDADNTGLLTLQEATSWSTNSEVEKTVSPPPR